MKKEIKTNYREGRCSYPLCNGENKEGWIMKLKESHRETNEEFFERLASSGYTKISLYEVSTRIKGLHDTIAYVKRESE